ncbi:4-hydroxy-tetrahydrodipicolinate synthase [Heliobacterium undosum]|uniref:4-hydroxy-tetrahydrodipicolinate synthase n=1 Tax=Heliomicrobium undosum TaxID=121734 RepID=A0A845L3E5_9FIRM|nr:4-hydroxy-tetrahydrodipicolinate synthase [Heliomicrobium undosum]MZP31142.1 4-hydroxy-tetrahydrodipicolinate synthase [Heliomicrobium undosum]
MEFGRLITAMVTPFNDRLEVDYARAAELANYLVNTGSDGIVVAGTTGESPTLTKDEKIRLFSTVVDAVGNRASVIAGTGSYDTEATIELSRKAKEAGVDGLLLVGPYYNKPPQEGYYRHFAAVAKAVPLPIMLYNIPGRTGSNILPATVERLMAFDNIVAIKEAAGSMDQVSEVVRLARRDFKVYSGDDSLTLPILSVGGHGIVSVAGHLVGKEIQKMIAACINGNIPEAARIHQELYPLFKGLFITSNPICVKAALNLLGRPVGGVRLPLVEANDQEVAAMRQLIDTYGLDASCEETVA